MLSIVVIGRNDQHGYNLAKRVASSLNSISLMLTGDDELIFVDWNTDTGLPALPISIQDDLLPKTKNHMRVIRVPGSIHKALIGDSTRALLEPIARNVGIRRAKQNSSWILSTNTDILMASRNGITFSDSLVNLQQKLYLSYRFEIPEFLWDELDRRDPNATAKIITRWYEASRYVKRIRVDQSIEKNFAIPDGVGDFQLAPSSLWKKVTGFPESMTKGWHIDTRLTLQMAKVSSDSPELLDEKDLIIFHQNHLRNSTSYHNNDISNDASLIHESYKNAEDWGLANLNLEEFQFVERRSYISKMEQLIPISNSKVVAETEQLTSVLRRLDYNLTHVLHFLMDELSLLPQGSVIHCFSSNSETISAITQMCKQLNLMPIFPEIGTTDEISAKVIQDRVDLLIIDCGVASESPVLSPYWGGSVSQLVLNAGKVVRSIPDLGLRYADSNCRVVLIRAQNWGTRSLAREYFSLPLFNNYTSILAGQVKKVQRKSRLSILKYRAGVISDYSLGDIDSRDAAGLNSLDRILEFLLLCYRSLPDSIRQIIKKFLR